MKKYILLLPLAVLALVSSCSQDEPAQNPNEERYSYYTRAFIREFGIMDPNHTWGFGAGVLSRTADPDYNQWKTPPPVSETEENLVATWLSTHNYEEKLEVAIASVANYKRYFVYHVYSSHAEQENMNGEKFDCSSKMDQLVIAEFPTSEGTRDSYMATIDQEGGIWEHVKDFNKAVSTDYNGTMVMHYSDEDGGNEEDYGAYHFAYHQNYHNGFHDTYLIIPGSAIDPSLSAYSYVCFDFDSHADSYTSIMDINYTTRDDADAAVEPHRAENVQVDGAWAKSWGGEDGQRYTLPDPDDATLIAAIKADMNTPIDNDYTGTVTIKSYTTRQVVNGDKIIPQDYSYDDWVIRLVNGAVLKTSDETPPYEVYDGGDPVPNPDDPVTPTPTLDKRIMVEDLAASAAYDITLGSSDWDFNDLVLDVTLAEDGSVQAVLQALGGTLPLYIKDANGHVSDELHSFFGVSSATMVNTNGAWRGTRDLTDALKDFRFTPGDYNSIQIWVAIGDEEVQMITTTGGAPSKILLPPTVEWASERQHITKKYGKFTQWVADENQKFWE